VHEPLAGEIRLQWWSDALGGGRRGEVEAHPVAAALLAAIERYGLPVEPLAALIEARRFDLYDEPMATLADLEAYAERASSSLIALAASVLGGGREGEIGALARHAGLAHAIAGLLKAFPIHAARGQTFVPLEILGRHGAGRPTGGPATAELRAALAEMRIVAGGHLAQAQDLMAATPPVVLPALLPAALAGPTLARMERRGYDPFVPVEIAPLRRQWLIWRAARRPQRMFG
jgi:phytoene synthase